MEDYIFPFFWLHGEEEDKLREYVRVIKDSGCSAFCVESRPHPDFCGEKWWKDLDVIIDEAKKQDMRLWILDDSHFPTGFANGAAMKAEDKLRRQSVYTKVYKVKPGQRTFTITPQKAMEQATKQIPATFIQKMMSNTDKDAKHKFTDDRMLCISALVEGEGKPVELAVETAEKLTLTLPPKTTKVFMTYLTRNHGIHKSYMNMMDEDSCRLLIDAVYEKHYEHYSDEFGKTILGFFSDEPELGNGVYFKNDITMGTDMDFPWSRELEERIKADLGEDWKSLLPLIWDDCGNPKLAGEIRYKYMDNVTRLVEKCFSKQVGDWCRAHGVRYIGHIIEDGNAHARTANSLGHYFRGISGQDMAGIDDIGGQVLPFKEDAPAEGIYKMLGGRDGEFYHFMLGKLAGSMAALQPEKHGRSMCEIFGNYGWQEGPRMEKYLADHFMVQGINHFVPHAFSPKPYPDKDCPPHFYANGHNPQYRAFSYVISYMNRVCGLVSDGKAIVSTAVLYHGEGEWTGEAMLDQKPARILMENQVDFHIVPADAFEERERYQTEITADGLRINGNLYTTLIIPYTEFIRPEVAALIDELKNTQCMVLFLDKKPAGVIGQGSFAVEDGYSVIELKDLLSNVEREVIAKPANARLRSLHYKNARTEIYYLVNEDDKIYQGEITVPEFNSCVAYNAWEDKYEVQESFDNKSFRLTLRPSESRIILINPDQEVLSQAGENTVEKLLGNKKVEEQFFAKQWQISSCSAIDYPNFGEKKPYNAAFETEPFSAKNKKFSGFIAYDNQVKLEEKNGKYFLMIADAGEDVEVFVNGKSLGIQVLPPFYFDITDCLKNGENDIHIEVATTLERERGANKKSQAATGITGRVQLIKLGC